MKSHSLFLTFSLVAALTSCGSTTSLASQERGDPSKLKEKSILSRDTHLTDNLGEDNEGESGSLAEPSQVNTKWSPHLPLVHKIRRDDISFNLAGHQPKPSLLTSGFQLHPFETIPDHFNVITSGSFHNRAPVLDPFHSKEGQPFFGKQNVQNLPLVGLVNRPLGGPIAEERQFRPTGPQQRPQRGPPRNLRGPVFTQDNPALSPPPPRPRQNFNPPIPTHPDISLIPLQSTGDSGVNDLLEERFPPFNDPVLPGQFTAVKKDPAITTEQPLPQLITQEEPLPLSHQNPGELTQQAPSPQLLEPQRFQPRQNATTRPRHLESLFPLSQQRFTPPPQPPTTRNPTSFIRHSAQPTPGEPSPQQSSPEDIAQPNNLSLNPAQPFVEASSPQFPFDGSSQPSFERIPQLVPPPQFPPQELNHISQEPSLPLTKPTVLQPNVQKTRPEFQQTLQLRDPQKPINQQSPLETLQQQNQPFIPSPPQPPPPPQGNPSVQPFPFNFQRPQRPARGQPNFRPPPPPRGRRRPLIPVRIRDPRRPRQLTTPSVPRNSASRRPRSEGPFQAREHSPDRQPQQGPISPFASGEDPLLVAGKDVNSEEDLSQLTHPITEDSSHTISPPSDNLPIPTGIPLVFTLSSDPPHPDIILTGNSRKPTMIQRAEKAQKTISKVWNRFTKNVARTTAGVAGTIGHVTGRVLGEGTALLSSAGNTVKKAVDQMDEYGTGYSDSPKAHSLSSGFHLTLPNYTHVNEHKFGLRFSMSSSHPGVPAMPLVGVDFDSSVVSRPNNYQQGKEKAFLKPYFSVTSVPVHPVITKQFPKYKTRVIHVRPWKSPEQKGQSQIYVDDPSEQEYSEELPSKISGPVPVQRHPREPNFSQSHFYVDDPLKQKYSKEPASEISDSVSFQNYDYHDETYDRGVTPNFKFSDSVDYEEQPLDSDFSEFSEPYRFTEFRNNDRPLDSLSHSSSNNDHYPPIIIAKDDFFRRNLRTLHPRGNFHPHIHVERHKDTDAISVYPRGRFPSPSHIRKDEDSPSPGIRKIISHIRETIHREVVNEPEISSLLGKPLINRPHEDYTDDFPDNIQEIKKIINHPKYPSDYYRSTIPTIGDPKSQFRETRPPFRFP